MSICKHCGNETLGVEVAERLKPMCRTCWDAGVGLSENDAKPEAER